MENTLTTQSVDVNLVYNQAAVLLLEQKLPAEQCIQAMVSNGIGEEQARNAVADIQGQILAAKKERAKKDILYGALWCAGGTIGTLANTGFIFWGAILFGGIQLIKGLINSSATE